MPCILVNHVPGMLFVCLPPASSCCTFGVFLFSGGVQLNAAALVLPLLIVGIPFYLAGCGCMYSCVAPAQRFILLGRVPQPNLLCSFLSDGVQLNLFLCCSYLWHFLSVRQGAAESVLVLPVRRIRTRAGRRKFQR